VKHAERKEKDEAKTTQKKERGKEQDEKECEHLFV